jgi:undecaprenyl diphosphate synthase
MSQPAPQLSAEARANLPTHVAVIMDGNGRWAKERGLPRVEGHRQGAESVKAVVKAAGELGIKFITLYAFSVENWNRPKDEVDTLMKYLLRFLKRELAEMSKNNIRLQAIGQIWKLPENIQEQLQKTTQATAKNNGITLTLALSYGGRTEIVDAVRQIAHEVKAGKLEAGEINEQVIAHHLYTHGTPDPDLLIRTSGEMRVSNFLLWQISYAEFVITKTLWPDFGKREFYAALEEYSLRQRRYGGV